ncbi:MAG: hypothetical protein U1F68_09550 [Gammaproteobacteria bacterium]
MMIGRHRFLSAPAFYLCLIIETGIAVTMIGTTAIVTGAIETIGATGIIVIIAPAVAMSRAIVTTVMAIGMSIVYGAAVDQSVLRSA